MGKPPPKQLQFELVLFAAHKKSVDELIGVVLDTEAIDRQPCKNCHLQSQPRLLPIYYRARHFDPEPS